MELDSRDVAVAAFESLMTPLLVTDLAGRVVAANPAYCSVVRRCAADLPGAASMEFVHPDDWFTVTADVLSLVEGRSTFAVNERRHLRPDGTEVRLRVTARLLHREGKPPLVMNQIGHHQEVPPSNDLELARAKAIHAAVQEGVSMHDGHARLVRVTSQVKTLLGRQTSELLGCRWTDSSLRPVAAAAEPLELTEDPVQQAIDRQAVVERTMGLHRADGRVVWLAIKATPLPGGGAISSLSDLSDLVSAEEDRERLAGIVHRTADLVFMWGRSGWLTYVNETARLALGLAPGDEVGSIRINDVFPTRREEERNREVLEALWYAGRWTGDTELLTPCGRRMPVSVVVLAALDGRGRFSRFSAVAHDLTSRVQLEAELEHRATRDPLTGLANRWLLHDQLASFLARGSATVVYLDLDDFKVVNDSQGHAAGDRLLVEVARCLRDLAPADALVARPGGDEFVVVLPAGTSPGPLLDALPGALGVLGVQASAGVATADDGDDGTTLLARADEAMYGVKGRAWITV